MSVDKQNKPSVDQRNGFDRAEKTIHLFLTCVFVITGMVSAYASFSGFNLFAEEVGGLPLLSKGTAVILTIAVASIMIVGWSLITKYGPEARGTRMKICMVLLGAALLAITLAISSLSNLMALAGPAAKVHDWRDTHAEFSLVVDQLESNAMGAKQLLPGWRAEAAKACQAATQEVGGGMVSGTGRGAGPVAFALSGVCAQTNSFVTAIEETLAEIETAVGHARLALQDMRATTRNRNIAVIEREDRFLLAGDVLNMALQQLRAADLTLVLEAGAQQVRASVAELSVNSTYTPKQVETVRSIHDGIEGLVTGTDIIVAQLRQTPIPERRAITSPDYIEAVMTHAHRFVPVFATAIGIDLFQLWALLFMLVGRAGQPDPLPRQPFWRRVVSTSTEETKDV
jgi:hypothetical protein